MLAGIALLKEHAADIAADTAEFYDVPNLEPSLAAIISNMATALESNAPLQITPLRAAGLDNPMIARMLRGVTFKCIEDLRQTLDETAYTQTVLALRECVHGVIPRPAVNPEDREFYRRLMIEDPAAFSPEFSRLVSLFHDIGSTFRDIIYIHDLSGSLLYVNVPGLTISKYALEDVLASLSIYDFVVPEFLEMIETRMESPGAVSRSPYTSEIYTKDGVRIPVEISTRCLVRDRQIVGIVGLARDLRLARRLETELRRTNALLDSLMDGAPIGIIQVNEHGMIVEANPAALTLLGYTTGIIGASCDQLQNEGQTQIRDLVTESIARKTSQSAKRVELASGERANLTVIPISAESATAGAYILLI